MSKIKEGIFSGLESGYNSGEFTEAERAFGEALVEVVDNFLPFEEEGREGEDTDVFLRSLAASDATHTLFSLISSLRRGDDQAEKIKAVAGLEAIVTLAEASAA